MWVQYLMDLANEEMVDANAANDKRCCDKLRGVMTERSIFEAALVGLQHQLGQIEDKISELRRRIRVAVKKAPPLLPSLSGPRKRRRMSAAARKRIGDTTRKRWV